MQKTLSLLLLLISFRMYAQQSGAVTGKVLDTKTQAPVPYASIGLRDTSMKVISGVITNEKGDFEINEIPAGHYKLQVQYVGYRLFEKDIMITPEKAKQHLGNLLLERNITDLNEHVVTGEKSQVMLQLDKKVFLVGKDILSQSGSAIDILDNIPSVTVDAKGVVSIRGNSNVNVLVNGKRSGLTLNNALEQIPADNIEKIELITTPSAQYDAEGSAGIINIVLKKSKDSGFTGQVRVVGGHPNDERVNVNLNYRTGKLNLFSNIGYLYADYIGYYTSSQSVTDTGVTTLLNMVQHEKRHDDGKVFYLGGDYFINDKNSVTLAFFRNETRDSDKDRLDYSYGDANSTDLKDSTLARSGTSKENRNYNQLEFNYTHHFEKKDRKLTLDMQYDFWNSDKDWHLDTKKTYPVEKDLSPLRTSSDGSSKDFLIQSDFANPIGEKSKLDLGVKLENRSVVSDYRAETLVADQWLIYEGINNVLDYDERIGSAYAQFQSKAGKFSYMAGLRAEFTHIEISDHDNTYNNRKDYNKLFPSLGVSYLLKESTTLQLNFSRRISRPSLQLLYPFVELTNFNSQYIGNPEMDPAYSNVVQLNLLQHWSKITFHPSIYFQQTKDFIFFYTSRNDNASFITMPVNLEKETRYGVELSGTYDPLKWLQFTAEYNLYGFEQRGEYDRLNFDYSNVSWNTRIGTRVKMIYGFTFQGRYNLVSPQNNSQSHTKSLYYVDLGLSKSFLKDKCVVVFDATNVLNTRKTRVTVKGDNFVFNRVINSNAARYRLSVVYRFNQNSNQSERKEKATNRN